MNELTVFSRIQDPIAQAEQMGIWLFRSGMFSLINEQAGAVIAFTCLCEGITPLEFRRTYHVIKGAPSMRADAMLAKFNQAGGRHRVIERSSERAAVLLTVDDNEFVSDVVWSEVQNEDFAKDKDGGVAHNYRTPRKRMQMLWARAVSDGIRVVMPSVVAGVYTPEEHDDNEVVRALPVQSYSADSLMSATEQPVEVPFEVVGETVSAQPSAETNSALDTQLMEIELAFAKLGATDAVQQSVLTKRGVKSLGELSRDQAEELLKKLRDQIALLA